LWVKRNVLLVNASSPEVGAIKNKKKNIVRIRSQYQQVTASVQDITKKKGTQCSRKAGNNKYCLHIENDC
jgi:hypothetical protein